MLVPTLRALLADALIDLTQLTAVVVVDGPGSFTGIRIGLSAVKALAEALNLPVYPISRLRVLAQTHSAAGAAMGAVLDAGRGEFYLGQYTPQLAPKRVPASHPDRDGIPAPASDRAPHPAPAPSETLLTREELAAYLSSPAPGDPTRPLVACEEKVIAAFPDLHPPIRLVDLPTAASAIAAALPDLLHAHAANVLTLDGRYIRRSGLYRTTEPAPPRPDIPRDITRP
jgi:tRNA threonylcarbamoyladenosine biosynthesis protein TsaB